MGPTPSPRLTVLTTPRETRATADKSQSINMVLPKLDSYEEIEVEGEIAFSRADSKLI